METTNDSIKSYIEQTLESGSLDLIELEQFFEQKGYSEIHLSKKTHNIVGTLIKDGVKYFAKISTTKHLSTKGQNAVSWFESFAKFPQSEVAFKHVKVVEAGWYTPESFYYLKEYIEGVLFTDRLGAGEHRLGADLVKIIECIDSIVGCKDIHLFNDAEKAKEDEGERVDRYIKLAQGWAAYVPKEFDLANLLTEILNLKDTYKKSLNHGNLVPKHIIFAGEQVYLVDPEWASNFGPKYYDVANFMHRTWVFNKSPEVAKKFYEMFLNSRIGAEKEELTKMIRPLLASRLIGGYYEESVKPESDRDYTLHDSLRDYYKSLLLNPPL